MYGIITLLIILMLLIIFYKWCGRRKKLFYKVLLCVGLLPFVCNFIISIVATKNGFTLFDLETVYGLEAIARHFVVYIVFYCYIFIPAIIAIIVSIIKLIKLRK